MTTGLDVEREITISTLDACVRLGLSARELFDLIRSGDLSAVWADTNYVVRESDVERLKCLANATEATPRLV
jgi:hypothetical protein